MSVVIGIGGERWCFRVPVMMVSGDVLNNADVAGHVAVVDDGHGLVNIEPSPTIVGTSMVLSI